MRSLLIGRAGDFQYSATADTYTGVVSDVKHFHNGGVAVDLDGRHPDQKMTLYISPAEAPGVGTTPSEGVKVTATGKTEPYRGNQKSKSTQQTRGNGEASSDARRLQLPAGLFLALDHSQLELIERQRIFRKRVG
jgi:hypothetical protein